MNEKTAKLINKFARAAVPPDLEGAGRIQRLLVKQVKAQWKVASSKEKASIRRSLQRRVSK